MRIATKLNTGLLLVFVASAAANALALFATVKPRFDDIERSSALLNHARVTGALDVLKDRVRAAAQDYAFWDESYAFIKGEDGGTFIASNITPASETLQALGVNVLVYTAADGKVLLAEAVDLTSRQPLPELAAEIAALNLRHEYPGGGTEPIATTGLIGSSQGTLLMAVAPIIRSDHSGPPAGSLVMASLLDARVVKSLTGVKFVLDPVEASPGATPSAAILARQGPFIETASLLSDITGKPLAVLRASTPRDISAAGTAALSSAVLLTMSSAALAGLALWFLAREIVVNRVAALGDHFATAGDTGHIRLVKTDHTDDEIGQLSRAFDAMAERVNTLQDALAGRAFDAGLAEWASGTLHNVRNGLAPVESYTWDIRNALDPEWLATLERVMAELRDPGADSGRRADLTAYLEASARRFAEAGERVRGLTGRIDEANRAVVDIVSQFEEHARRDTRLEPVDVAELVADLARAPLRTRMGDVEVVLPEPGTAVLANRIVLRQVVANVLINAAEAIEASGRRGVVHFKATRDMEAEPQVTLSVTDNGEGLDRERLDTLFQLGTSTRSGRRGGLGLHWCANAMKQLGGSIRAESAGPGRGATFVLTLPSAPESERETV